MRSFRQELTQRYDSVELINTGIGIPYLMRFVAVAPEAPDIPVSSSLKCAHCGNAWIEGAAYCVYCLQAPVSHLSF